jgi:hypothetical protein
MHLVANHPSGFAVLRKLVMKQLDHHRGRVIATSDHEITVPPFDLLELIRGNDAVHNQDEVRKVIEALELENKIFHPQNGGENDDEDHVLTMDAANNGGIVDHKAGYDEQHHVSLKGNTHKELGALILMNHISEKDVSQELVDHALQAVFADSHEQHKLEDLMERYGSTEQEMESMQVGMSPEMSRLIFAILIDIHSRSCLCNPNRDIHSRSYLCNPVLSLQS